MKYAFMSFSCPELTLAEMLDTAENLGYAGVEPRLEAGHAHGIETALTPEERKAVHRQVAYRPVELCCLASSARFADPATCDRNLEAARRELDLTADLGIPALRIFGGQFPDSVDRAEAIDSLAEALTALTGQADACHTTLCLETHDAWCNPHHVAQVLRQVNHPRAAANWDVLHPVRAEGMTLPESLAILSPWIRHVHMHDATLDPGHIRYVPIGTGAIDHQEVIRGLQAMAYTGYMSGEWINYTPWHAHLPDEMARLQQIEARLD